MLKREVCIQRKIFSLICVIVLATVQVIAIKEAADEYLYWKDSGELGSLIVNCAAVVFLILSLSDLIADFSAKYRAFVDNIRYKHRKLCITEMAADFIFAMMTIISFGTFGNEWLSFEIDDTPSAIIVTILFCLQFANMIIMIVTVSNIMESAKKPAENIFGENIILTENKGERHE